MQAENERCLAAIKSAGGGTPRKKGGHRLFHPPRDIGSFYIDLANQLYSDTARRLSREMTATEIQAMNDYHNQMDRVYRQEMNWSFPNGTLGLVS